MNEKDDIRYREAFFLLDENQSGLIPTTNLPFLIRALGFTPTEDDLKQIQNEIGPDKLMDYSFFVSIISTFACTKYSYEDIETAFFAFDQNHYGLINPETLKKALTSIGEPLSDTEIDEIMADLPVDEDGFIDYKKYCSQFNPKDDQTQNYYNTNEDQ